MPKSIFMVVAGPFSSANEDLPGVPDWMVSGGALVSSSLVYAISGHWRVRNHDDGCIPVVGLRGMFLPVRHATLLVSLRIFCSNFAALHLQNDIMVVTFGISPNTVLADSMASATTT